MNKFIELTLNYQRFYSSFQWLVFELPFHLGNLILVYSSLNLLEIHVTQITLIWTPNESARNELPQLFLQVSQFIALGVLRNRVLWVVHLLVLIFPSDAAEVVTLPIPDLGEEMLLLLPLYSHWNTDLFLITHCTI